MPRKATKVSKQESVESDLEIVEPIVESISMQEVSDSSKKSRYYPTKESVSAEFDELERIIQAEIDNRRQNGGTGKSKTGVKFLQSINKKLKTLRAHSVRIMRTRKSTRVGNPNSGFNKPVQISKELAKFTQWGVDTPRSRSETTKFLCNYIKEHELQNPENRREISIDKDPKLKKLLGFDKTKDDKPLTYPRLQIYLKKHYTALPAVKE